MKQLLVVITLLASIKLFAQMPPEGMRQGGAPSIRVFGRVIDKDSKNIGEATVILMRTKPDSANRKSKQLLFKSTLSKANGDFSFEDVPLLGSYTLKINNIGFKPYEQPINLFPKMDGGAKPTMTTEKDLGKVQLTTDAKDLQEVTVTSTVSSIKLNADKKVFNVEKNIMSAGGTGVDVMRNVPSVNVDIDGNITLRNSAPQLLVDGRPTTLTLDQIPADAIESVEVITNPSAKYDASGGGAGILNIVLKKNRKTGYNGNIRAGVDKRGAVNGGGDFNVRQDKINFNATINLNQNKDQIKGTTERTSLLTTPQTVTDQNNFSQSKGGFFFAKAGLDYFITNRTTLSLSGMRVHGEFNPYESIGIEADSLYSTGKISSVSQRVTTGSRVFNGRGITFGFKQTFPKQGEELTVDANYFDGKGDNSLQYNTTYLANSGLVDSMGYQKTIGSGKDNNFVIQTDYVLPFSASGKLEAGLRAAIRSRTNLFDNYVYSNQTQQYNLVASATSNYTNNDNVYAAYGIYSNSFKSLNYKIGLRAESSNYTGKLTSSGQTFSNNYPVSLFPSVFLSEKLANRQELQLSYSRRINRPNFFQLIPFTDYTDKLNITRGNPNLVPEFTQSLELSYLKTFQQNNTFLASIYYKHTDNLITRYLTEEKDAVSGTTELINTYINANSSYSVGSELTMVNNLYRWWDISTNVNVYNSQVNTSNVTSSQGAMWSMFGKFNSNFKLPSNFAIQLTTTYQSKTNLPVSSGNTMGGPPMSQSQSSSQGYIASNWGMDLALKKSFLKNNAAAVSLSVSDIFRTRTNTQYSSSDYFTQTYSRLRDPQMFKLNFSYRFGKLDVSLFKRKSNGGDSGASDSVQQ